MTPLKINLVQHLGKGITHLKGEKKKVPMCQNRAFIYCPIYYSLSKISISLTFPFSPLYNTCCGRALEFCATQVVSLVAAITKACQGWEPNWQGFLLCQRLSIIAMLSYCWRKGSMETAEPNGKEHLKESAHLASTERLAVLNRA